MSKLKDYRPCAGIVLFNGKGRVWMGKRKGHNGPHSWQFPQGGIDKGENPRSAAKRELWEETGIRPKLIVPLDKVDGWLTYDFPKKYKSAKVAQGWQGQKQKWFAYHYVGDDSDFNLKAHAPQEFTKGRWVKLSETPDMVIPFKRSVYEHLAVTFERYTHPVI